MTAGLQFSKVSALIERRHNGKKLTEGEVGVKSPLMIIRQMEKKELEIIPAESPAGSEER